MDSKSWNVRVSHIQGHNVCIYSSSVFNSVDVVNLKVVDLWLLVPSVIGYR